MENLVNINRESVGNKIYTIRGEKVMLDFDLAEIYGYTTSAFNRQIKNNIDRFDEDFRFRLTEHEYRLVCKNYIAKTGRGGNRFIPYAFTEQGIYMLMTVLKGDVAIRQSKILIRLFKALKDDYLYRHNSLAPNIIENAKEIETIKYEVKNIDSKIRVIEQELNNVLKKSDISPILLNFSRETQNEFVFMNGELAKATETYIDIYGKAKKNIYIIDDYINIKTLRQLRNTRNGVEIIVYSDNKANTLRKSDYNDFRKEYPNVHIKFIKTNGLIHDRFIIIDYDTKAEIYYHLGASIKDTGNKVSMINILSEDIAKRALKKVLENIKENGILRLR